MQGEGGGTPPEKGTRLARAECNDSLEEKRKTGRTRRKIGGTVEKEGERERVHRIERKDASSAALVAVFLFVFPRINDANICLRFMKPRGQVI